MGAGYWFEQRQVSPGPPQLEQFSGVLGGATAHVPVMEQQSAHDELPVCCRQKLEQEKLPQLVPTQDTVAAPGCGGGQRLLATTLLPESTQS